MIFYRVRTERRLQWSVRDNAGDRRTIFAPNVFDERRKIKKEENPMKKLLALALALIMVLSLGSALADEKTTVVFWYSLSGTNADAIKEIVDRYNASQDKVFVQAEYEGEYDDAINKLKAAAIG